MQSHLNGKQVTIQLSEDEATILFEFLDRIIAERESEIFIHQAEYYVSAQLTGALERAITSTFLPDYADHLQKIRNAATAAADSNDSD